MGFDSLTRKKDDAPLVARDKELRDAKKAAGMEARPERAETSDALKDFERRNKQLTRDLRGE